ncbi:unnamed protein product [Acanthoscelides obtectus]|uniref:Piezo-type mechanosensitive ion channel component n=1 Tax=Acanthoscelides obtectus TaxID=200917 RepID=A0A9P0PRY6_ACAOB|nr:unnamed protein product [Acanthoscelides obtectus]CAK1668263.1 Piezo-type mechanosensitive ion channel component [Acanthoscelides obtectus]
MTRYGLGMFILRIIVPVLISMSIIVRPSFMCLIYMAMLLYLPFINLLDERNIDTGAFKYMMIFLPFQTFATQAGFYLYTLSTDEISMDENARMRRLMKNIGLSAVDSSKPLEIIFWMGPECVMLLVSILYTWAVKMMASAGSKEAMGYMDINEIRQEKLRYLQVFTSAGKFITICMLLLSALWKHAVFGLLYFLLFLFFISCWAFNKDLRRLLSIVLFFCMPIAMIHIIWEYMYQIEIIQDSSPEETIYNRLFGIDRLATPSPTYGPDFTMYVFNTKDWINLLHPIILYVLYYFMVNTALMLRNLDKFLLEDKRRGVRTKWRSITRKVKRMMQGRKFEMNKKPVHDHGHDTTRDRRWSRSFQLLKSFLEVTRRYSYVLSICVIMVWSITFINVTSIWMLILGIVLWMIPDKRKATLICSFPLCIYAYLSMMYTYMLGMGYSHLFEIKALGLGQMSIFQFMEFSRKSTVEVIIKLLYTVPFWSTIRHYMEERQRKRTAKYDILRTQSEMIESEKSLRSRSLLEKVLKTFFVKYWLVVLTLFLYAVAITGVNIGIMRALEMFQCILFLFILQMSFKAWRRILYIYMVFLLLMCLFTMSMFYSYQFAATHDFLDKQLNIKKDIKESFLGIYTTYTLWDYVTAIVVPAIYIVFILLQMTFFHKPFMQMSDENNTKAAEEDDRNRALYGKHMRRWVAFVDFAFLFMEQHLMKLVILLIYFMCIGEVCAINFIILAPLCITMVTGRYSRLYVIYWAALVVSTHTVMKMVYAMSIFDASDYNVTCNVTKHPEHISRTRNFAKWLGFKKFSSTESTLFKPLMWQTLFVATSALWSIVCARQRIVRKQHGLDTQTPEVMFPEITYRESDINLKTFLKYVLNYGYYRLGYEITLICLVVVISVRLDGYAIIYAGWLCVLLALPRIVVRYIWILFTSFISLSIIWQYIMVLGAPPQWCYEYEWETRTHYWTVAQDFWFLVDNYHPPPPYKLAAESVLALFACKQLQNFNLEIRLSHRGNSYYEGGNNHSIISHFEEPDHVNPVTDFTTYNTSYLDVFKRILFSFSYYGSMWIVFLGSVNRVNIFSIVYLCYVFVHLWYGLNLYYKPLPVILKYWNQLIAQNVIIILIKALLQVIGCFYMYVIPLEYCPYLRLFGIGCVRRFEPTDYFEKLEKGLDICKAATSEMSGIEWDAAIFAFLIMQRRVFSSYNFFLIIDDTKAGHLLSTRGAEILGEARRKELNAITEEQKSVRERIILKIKKVEENKAKIQECRSGHYELFDELEDQVSIDILPKMKEMEVKQTVKKQKPTKSLVHLISVMYQTDMRTAVRGYYEADAVSKRMNQWDEPYKWYTKVLYLLKFCYAAMDIGIVSATGWLEQHNRDYVEVRAILNKEKRLLKETTDYHVGVRVAGWWLPRASYQTLLSKSKLSRPKRPPREMSLEEQPHIVKLMQALWLFTVSKSDLLAYFAVIMNQVMLSQLITIPLSIMVFFWGSLCNPRTSRTFWIVMIGYVELVILLKCIFQFYVMPGNQYEKVKSNTKMDKENPQYPPVVFGLQQMDLYYIYEMFILIAILLQRHYLKNIGLWTAIRDTTREVQIDGNYVLNNGDFEPADAETSITRTEYRIKSTGASILDNIVKACGTIILQYAIGFREFYQRLLYHDAQKAVDLYTLMFLCDISTFILVTMGYPSFFEYDSDVSVVQFFTLSSIPVPFVMVVFAHFVSIGVDRCIYLKKNVIGKLTYHVLNTIWLHVWLFLLLPLLTNGRMAKDMTAVILYYIARCLYLLVSAYQIRYGYPSRIWGYFYAHNFTFWNLALMKIYMFIPFLYELRTALDWMLTDTAMVVFDWFKMEDMYMCIYEVKCKRLIEEEYWAPVGIKKQNIYKYMYGLGFVALILVIIWFPIMTYSWGRAKGISNTPTEAKLTFTLGKYEPIYDNVAQLYKFQNQEFEYMKKTYNAFEPSKNFLYDYAYTDVVAMIFNSGGQIWMIRDQGKKMMVNQMKGCHPIKATLKWEITLLTDGKQKQVTGQLSKSFYPFTSGRREIVKMMTFKADKDTTPQGVRYFLPKFLKVTQTGEVSEVDVLMKRVENSKNDNYNIVISFKYTVRYIRKYTTHSV